MTFLPCMVCDAPMSPYFVKDFGGQYGLGDVRYTHCAECRFVQSDTHFAMTDAEWAHVNETGHSYQGTDENLSDPRWLERLEAQRDVFVYLDSVGALPLGRP